MIERQAREFDRAAVLGADSPSAPRPRMLREIRARVPIRHDDRVTNRRNALRRSRRPARDSRSPCRRNGTRRRRTERAARPARIGRARPARRNRASTTSTPHRVRVVASIAIIVSGRLGRKPATRSPVRTPMSRNAARDARHLSAELAVSERAGTPLLVPSYYRRLDRRRIAAGSPRSSTALPSNQRGPRAASGGCMSSSRSQVLESKPSAMSPQKSATARQNLSGLRTDHSCSTA